ncbi:MAG: M17 family peptidase N-terminal domain-containing protein, partial [Dokdonella sp.]
MMTLSFSPTRDTPETNASHAIVVGVYEDSLLSPSAARLDERSGGVLKRLIESGDASGKLGNSALLLGLNDIASPRIVVIGLGEQKKFDSAAYHRASHEAGRALKKLPIASATSYLTEIDVPGRDLGWKIQVAALAADHTSYRYTSTFKAKAPSKHPMLETVSFASSGDTSAALSSAAAIAAGVLFARDLGNLPPNICNPAYVADQARK